MMEMGLLDAGDSGLFIELFAVWIGGWGGGISGFLSRGWKVLGKL